MVNKGVLFLWILTHCVSPQEDRPIISLPGETKNDYNAGEISDHFVVIWKAVTYKQDSFNLMMA